MRITTKGQVTIPADLREAMGMLPNTEVNFRRHGKNEVVIFRTSKKASKKPSRGDRIVAHLTGRGNKKLTTDEIMALTRGD